MPADGEPSNTLSPAVRDRSVTAGDVPQALGRCYFTDGRGGAGLGFYVDAKVQTPAFRDRGRQLVAARADPNAIRDMVAIARHRSWTAVTVRGAADFRREAWLAGRLAGLEVRGYPPTSRDLQELERRQAAQARRAARTDIEQPEPGESLPALPAAVCGNMRIVESVVRSRIAEPSAQERVLTAARERLARWLEQDAQVRPIVATRSADQDAPQGRQHRRSR